jgi:hypothetical protein
MTGAEALELLAAAQDLLRQQAAALLSGEIARAGALGHDVGLLLDRATHDLEEVDAAMRERLLSAARSTADELAKGVAALEVARGREVDDKARVERDGAALKRYRPATAGEPARFLDERR